MRGVSHYILAEKQQLHRCHKPDTRGRLRNLGEIGGYGWARTTDLSIMRVLRSNQLSYIAVTLESASKTSQCQACFHK